MAELARHEQVTATGVAAVDTDSWKNLLPDPMSAGYVARLLEVPPWTAVLETVERMETQFSAFCRHTGIPCSTLRPSGDPAAFLVDCSRFHDLLIAGVPPVLDAQTDQALDRALSRTGGSGIPVLRPSLRFESVNRVLLLLTEDYSSFRALRSFLQLGLWPLAEATLASVGSGTEQSVRDSAAEYCASHDIVPRQRMHFAHWDDFTAWAQKECPDLVVSGWSSVRHFADHTQALSAVYLLP
jgi:hypothetical protein